MVDGRRLPALAMTCGRVRFRYRPSRDSIMAVVFYMHNARLPLVETHAALLDSPDRREILRI